MYLITFYWFHSFFALLQTSNGVRGRWVKWVKQKKNQNKYCLQTDTFPFKELQNYVRDKENSIIRSKLIRSRLASKKNHYILVNQFLELKTIFRILLYILFWINVYETEPLYITRVKSGADSIYHNIFFNPSKMLFNLSQQDIFVMIFQFSIFLRFNYIPFLGFYLIDRNEHIARLLKSHFHDFHHFT